MMETIAEPPDPSCYPLFSGSRLEQNQQVDPDPVLPHTRDARGRFASGSSGNPRGRPRGIPNPKRRVPDLAARPLSPQALSRLIDRKPHLLRPLAARLLPPPLATIDPAERLAIDLSSVRTVEDLWQLLPRVLLAVSRGEIAPADGARIAERVHARMRAGRNLGRLQRRLARKAGAAATPPGLERAGRRVGQGSWPGSGRSAPNGSSPGSA
jgi:hypothetical protein